MVDSNWFPAPLTIKPGNRVKINPRNGFILQCARVRGLGLELRLGLGSGLVIGLVDSVTRVI